MLKYIGISLILLIVTNLSAYNPKVQRLQESAHPTPLFFKEKPKKYKIPYITQATIESKFLNVNTIIEDNVVGLPTQNESSIAVNPNNPKNLIASAVDYRDNSSSWVYVSHDGGKTWENINLGKVNGWRSSNDPSVMFDKDGTGYMVNGAFPSVASGENGVYIHRTTDEGRTWESHIPVIEHRGELEPDSLFEDKYYIEVDNSDDSPYRGHLYIPWKRVTPGDSATQIVVTKSTDKGNTWSTPVNVSERLAGSSEDTTFGQSFPLVSTGPEGEVYAIWNHGIEHGVGFNRSLDGGFTWLEPRIIHNYNIFGTTTLLNQGWRHTVKGTVRAEAYPVIKTDIGNTDKRGNIYVCWAADSIPNIYFSKSTDKGDTWTEPIIVHSETKNDQFWPWMGIDPFNGDIAIMYLDSRDTDDNILVDCYVSLSYDGGDTWIDRRASNVQWDLRHNPFAQNAFAGDYNGLDFYDGTIYPSWVDMRNASAGSPTDNDVYTAIVNVNAPSPVENFEVKLEASEPEKLFLNWEVVFESSFGKPLQSSDFNLELFRDNELITTLSPDISTYTDENLTAFQEYTYKIRAVNDKDSSIFRLGSGFPGGALKPDTVENIQFTVNINENISSKISLTLPEFRADKTTPLVNLSGLEMYRNGELIRTIELEPNQAGKSFSFDFEDDLEGYHYYSFAVLSDFEGSGIATQKSDISGNIMLYSGKFLMNMQGDSLHIDFDSHDEGYFIHNGFEKSDIISYSGGEFSISNSKNGTYQSNQYDTLYLIPFGNEFLQSENEYALMLDFMHIAVVHPGDSALVEYSNDLKKWNIYQKYSLNDFEPWQDEQLNQEDWKYERIDRYNDYPIFFRFRFSSNLFLNDLGWFIDHINIRPVFIGDVENQNESTVDIFPNPTSKYLQIKGLDNSLENTIKLMDLNGNHLLSYKNYYQEIIDLSRINSGVYFLSINQGTKKTKLFKVNIIK